jgi:hypothetical protein
MMAGLALMPSLLLMAVAVALRQQDSLVLAVELLEQVEVLV